MTSLKNKRRLTLIGIDSCIFLAVYVMVCVLLSFTDTLNLTFLGHVYNSIAIYTCILAARLVIGVYSNMWRYANSILSLELILADFIGGGVSVLLTVFIPPANIGGWRTCALVSMVCVMPHMLSKMFAGNVAFQFFLQSMTSMQSVGSIPWISQSKVQIVQGHQLSQEWIPGNLPIPVKVDPDLSSS